MPVGQRTTLDDLEVKEINDFIKDHYPERVNLGQTWDDDYVNHIHSISYKLYGKDTVIILRFCSPGYKGDTAGVFWYVLTGI